MPDTGTQSSMDRSPWQGVAFVGVVAILIAAVTWTIRADYAQAIRDAERQTDSLARALDEHIARTVNEIDQVMEFLKTVYERTPEDFDITSEVYRTITLKGSAFQVAFVDPDGEFRNGTLGPTIRRINLRREEAFRVHAERPALGLYVAAPTVDPISGRRAIPLSKRVNYWNGAFAGVIMATLDPDFFRAFLASIDIGPNGRFAIARTDGIGIAALPAAPGRDELAAARLTRHLMDASSGTVQQADIHDGIVRITSYRKLANLPLVVALGIAREDALSGWREESVKRVVAMTAFLALIAMLGFRARHRFKALRATAERLEKSQAALKQSDSRYALAARGANEGLYDWDIASGKAYYSPRFLEIAGDTQNGLDARRRGWLDAIHRDDRSRVVQSVKQVVEEGAEFLDVECRIVRPDGKERRVHLTGAAERGRDGAAIRLAGSLGDITEYRAAEEALRRAQKMEAIGRLSGGIGHDFNNLLSIVIGNLDLLIEDMDERPAERERAEIALKAALRGAALTKRLLAVARQLPAAKCVSDINAVVASMRTILSRALTSEIVFDIHSQPDLWSAEIDPGDLEDSILNLAINARDAMPSGGRLVIETGNARLDNDYAQRNPGVVPGDYVMIAVSDTGCGMSKATLEKAFEPFFSTKPAGSGTGLGLSMVYGFVKRSAGHIAIYSEPDHGTTVRIYLPRAAGPKANVSDVDIRRDDLPRGREKILVVDDEEDLRKLAVKYLTDLGYDTVSAADGPSALDIIERERNIDVLFSDVLMPGGINGYDLAATARRRLPTLKVLLTSGFSRHAGPSSDSPDVKLTDMLLVKPFRKTDLATKMREVIEARP